MNFGSSSSLERIGVSCFAFSGVDEVSIPDGVRELCEGCFKGCKKLRHVSFSSSSSLERIGALCFARSGPIDFENPVLSERLVVERLVNVDCQKVLSAEMAATSVCLMV